MVSGSSGVECECKNVLVSLGVLVAPCTACTASGRLGDLCGCVGWVQTKTPVVCAQVGIMLLLWREKTCVTREDCVLHVMTCTRVICTCRFSQVW